MNDKWFQSNAIGPVYSAVSLSLDNGFLGCPCDDVGGEVIWGYKLLLANIQELVSHAQNLATIHLFRIEANDPVVIDSQSHQTRRMCNTDIRRGALERWRPLRVMTQ